MVPQCQNMQEFNACYVLYFIKCSCCLMYLIISWTISVHFSSLQPFWPLSLHLHFSHFNRLCDRIFLFLFVLWWNWLYCLAVAVLYDHPFLVDHNCLISVLTAVTIFGGCCYHSLYAVVARDACNIYLLHRELLNLLINCVVVKKMGIIIKIINHDFCKFMNSICHEFKDCRDLSIIFFGYLKAYCSLG